MVHLIGWILNKTRSPRRTLAACPVVTHAVHPRGEDCRRANARSVSVLGCLLGVGSASPGMCYNRRRTPPPRNQSGSDRR